MTVAELIETLRELPGDLPVIIQHDRWTSSALTPGDVQLEKNCVAITV